MSVRLTADASVPGNCRCPARGPPARSSSKMPAPRMDAGTPYALKRWPGSIDAPMRRPQPGWDCANATASGPAGNRSCPETSLAACQTDFGHIGLLRHQHGLRESGEDGLQRTRHRLRGSDPQCARRRFCETRGRRIARLNQLGAYVEGREFVSRGSGEAPRWPSCSRCRPRSAASGRASRWR